MPPRVRAYPGSDARADRLNIAILPLCAALQDDAVNVVILQQLDRSEVD